MFSIETAIVDEIVRYNKVDCPFTLSSDTKEALKVTVDRRFIIFRFFGGYIKQLFLQQTFPLINFKFLILKG